MKILIIGTGVIGTIYGWALAESGNEVVHYVCKGKGNRYAGGIQLNMLDERQGHPKLNTLMYPVRCVEQITPSDAYELVLVSVNAFKVEAVLREIVPVSGNADFLIFCANWHGTGIIDRYLPSQCYVLGYPDGGGTYRNGLLWGNLGAEVHLGDANGKAAPLIERLKRLFEQADMKPDLPENILHWLWIHNVMSTPFWVGYWKYRNTAAFLSDRALLRQCILATKECLNICRRRGIDLSQYDDAQWFRFPIWLVVLMVRWLWTHNASMQRYTAHAASESDEPRRSFDSILQTGRELGVVMPNMEKLQSLAAQMPLAN
jgi:2-dehydropantoate 2-reductase